MLSKYEFLGQYSKHLPSVRTGRWGGQVRHDEGERGDEQVEQSEEQGRQVPFWESVLDGQVWTHLPLKAERGAGHFVHVVEVV